MTAEVRGGRGPSQTAGNGYEALGKAVLFVAILAASSVVSGLVLTRLWAWFVSATFGIQQLGIAQAIGFALLARFFFTPVVEPKQERKSFGIILAEATVRIVLINSVVLLSGLLVVQFT